MDKVWGDEEDGTTVACAHPAMPLVCTHVLAPALSRSLSLSLALSRSLSLSCSLALSLSLALLRALSLARTLSLARALSLALALARSRALSLYALTLPYLWCAHMCVYTYVCRYRYRDGHTSGMHIYTPYPYLYLYLFLYTHAPLVRCCVCFQKKKCYTRLLAAGEPPATTSVPATFRKGP
jgi:hypothetical protein